jgi:hypothetical protein
MIAVDTNSQLLSWRTARAAHWRKVARHSVAFRFA